MNLFGRVWKVYDLTPLIMQEAARGLRDYEMSYYDVHIWAASRLNQSSVIYGEDFAVDAALEGVRIINPFTSGFVLKNWV